MLCCSIKGKHAKLNHFDLSPGHLDCLQAQVWPIIAKLSNTVANERTRFLKRQSAPHLHLWKSYKHGMQSAKFLSHPRQLICTRMVQTKTKSRKHGTTPPAAQPLIAQDAAGEQTTSDKNGVTSTTKMTTWGPTNVSQAVQYERQLSKIINDAEMMLLTSNGNDDIATPFVYSLFEIMRTRGVELEDANHEVVLRAISDHKMYKMKQIK